MCHMMYYPPDVPVDTGDLFRAAQVNDEGSGFAFALEGYPRKLLIHRSMHAEPLIEAFAAIRGELLDCPAVFHSRLATTGYVKLSECHPAMTPDHQYALFLNGTLDITVDEGESDTQRFADTILADMDLDHPDNWNYVNNLAKHTDAKLLIMTSDPDSRRMVYRFNQDEWFETNYGAWASNRDHLGGPGNSALHGWDEITDNRENLWRWRNLAPDQCPGCHRRNCVRGCAPSPYPLAWRNETERKERVHAGNR